MEQEIVVFRITCFAHSQNVIHFVVFGSRNLPLKQNSIPLAHKGLKSILFANIRLMSHVSLLTFTHLTRVNDVNASIARFALGFS